ALPAAVLLLGAAPAAPQQEALVYRASLDAAIMPVTASFLESSLKTANDAGARLFILELDTPGGLVTSMEGMVRAITSSRAPVVVFVNGSKAASAGFFITIAADVAVMAPGTRIGAAHPVLAVGEIPKDSPMNAKIENDIAAYARSLASNRGRNAKAAEEAVRKSSAYTEREALKIGLIDFICKDDAEILKKLDGRTIKRFDGRSETLHLAPWRIVTLSMSRRERALMLLADPTLALILLLIGIIGLYVEFTHPGLIAPGLVGAISLLLFALSTQLLPLNWVGLALVALGITMFVLEIKVPSYGLLTLGGIVCLILGSLVLFKQPPSIPNVPQAPDGFGVARWAIASLAGTAGLIMAILTTLVARSHRRRPTTGSVGLVAEEGEALTDLDPIGRVFVHGEYWNARARTPIRKGARVRVVAVRDLLLDVEEVA
ncbi:MAG TPA: nodulation protein NfeD, partial [Candidatus Polarisedimenticolia bacterium]|nr:nodulation protein NfeD [Candidatus Polarisedimenticolia bacterium]